MEIKINRLGNTIEGHVLDVRKEPFLRALKDLDSRLYIKWNPEKNAGNGCWEIRIKPTKKVPVYKTTLNGVKYFELEYVEDNLIHHILDVPCLNYRVITRLREMDAYAQKDWLENMDYQAEKALIEKENKADAERRYLVKENKKYFRELQELVQSGYNPFSFFNGSK